MRENHQYVCQMKKEDVETNKLFFIVEYHHFFFLLPFSNSINLYQFVLNSCFCGVFSPPIPSQWNFFFLSSYLSVPDGLPCGLL